MLILVIPLNSCNSNSCNSKDHLSRTNSLVPSEFSSKPIQENNYKTAYVINTNLIS